MTAPSDDHDRRTDPVPTPAHGVRGVDQVEDMDNEPGEGTTRGADGDTAAREQQRKDLGERPQDADTEGGDDLEQAGALGEIDSSGGGMTGRGSL